MAEATTTSQTTNKVYKILVVDDEPSIRDLFVEALRDLSGEAGWEVSAAVDGTDALAKCGATKFDLIILDIVMPKKDGIQTLSEIKADPAKYGTPRVMMITNIGGDLAIEEALKLGAVGYRVKIEVEPKDLITLVKDELTKTGQPAAPAPQPAT